MSPAEQGWLAQKWVQGHTQRAIAAGLGCTAAVVNSNIKQFCDLYAGVDVGWEGMRAYGDARKAFVWRALTNYIQRYGEAFKEPPPYEYWEDVRHNERIIDRARYEHAWLLRAEGATLRQVGHALGVSHERARQMILMHGRRVQRALRHMPGLRVQVG